MKTIVIIILCFFCFDSYGQKFDDNAIYFVARGTLSKRELIGDRFNIFTKEITHVGLGLVTNGTLYIYNVSSDKKEKNSSLIVEKIADFKNVNDIFFMGIWQYKCSKQSILKVRNEIAKIKKHDISFDRKFVLRDDNQLYCSEFVYKVISCLKELNFKPAVKKLNLLEEQVLGVEKLTYIPVDFFMSNKSITKIKSEYVDFSL